MALSFVACLSAWRAGVCEHPKPVSCLLQLKDIKDVDVIAPWIMGLMGLYPFCQQLDDEKRAFLARVGHILRVFHRLWVIFAPVDGFVDREQVVHRLIWLGERVRIG